MPLYRNEIEFIWNLHQDGTLSAEQALRAIATEAGIVEQSREAKALGTLISKVASGELPVASLIGAIEGAVRDVTDVLPDVRLAVTRSAGDDRAVVVFVDTEFEPDASDGGPGLRVLLNDDEAYVGKAYDLPERHDPGHEAAAKHFEVRLDEIPYAEPEETS